MSSAEQKQKLADLLRDFRLKQNLSQRKLAARIGINPTSLTSYADGTSYPTPETRAKIAAAIGKTTPELEAYLNDVPVKPLAAMDQIKQDIRALSRAEFYEVAEVVAARMLEEMKKSVGCGSIDR
jgi:transcriptional regulator with XRE-family HTH domain